MASARWSAAHTKFRGPFTDTCRCSTSPRSRLRLRPARCAALIMTLRTAEWSMGACRKPWSGQVKLASFGRLRYRERSEFPQHMPKMGAWREPHPADRVECYVERHTGDWKC